MIVADRIAGLAERLRAAERTRVATDTFFRDSATDLASAYQIQRENIRHWLGEGRRPVGRKIGVTDAAVQRRLGLREPICGALFMDMLVESGATIPIDRLMLPKVEPEVAVILGRDLDLGATRADVIGAIRSVLPAIEIVGTRFHAGAATIADDVADNCGAGLVVVGPPLAQGLDAVSGVFAMTLASVGGDVRIEGALDGELVTETIVWLAERMMSEQTPLRKGDLIMTGALAPEQEVKSGTRVEVVFANSQPVVISFGKEEGGRK